MSPDECAALYPDAALLLVVIEAQRYGEGSLARSAGLTARRELSRRGIDKQGKYTLSKCTIKLGNTEIPCTDVRYGEEAIS